MPVRFLKILVAVSLTKGPTTSVPNHIITTFTINGIAIAHRYDHGDAKRLFVVSTIKAHDAPMAAPVIVIIREFTSIDFLGLFRIGFDLVAKTSTNFLLMLLSSV